MASSADQTPPAGPPPLVRTGTPRPAARFRRLPTMQQVAPFVTAIDHVGIAVPDFDAAVEFYRRTFGLELVHEEINEEQGVREGMLRAAGDPGTGAAVQLLAPLGPESTIAKFLDRNGPGLQQLA